MSSGSSSASSSRCSFFPPTNTAVVDLITIQFLMARDRELPWVFQKLNRWGVPSAGLLLATSVPIALTLAVRDMAGLADLYAVGVVGAIATNLGSTCTDRSTNLKRRERALMFFTFVVMAAIEVSLLIEKPRARYFAFTILAVGLVLRGLVQERRSRKRGDSASQVDSISTATLASAGPKTVSGHPMICAVRSKGRTLDFALREAAESGRRLYLLYVREQRFVTEEDRHRKWRDDDEAREIFHAAKQSRDAPQPLFCYAVSESVAATIVVIAATLGASRLILGAPRRNAFVHLLRGNVIRDVGNQLPEDIDLVVFA